MLNAFALLECSKKCQYNVKKSTLGQTENPPKRRSSMIGRPKLVNFIYSRLRRRRPIKPELGIPGQSLEKPLRSMALYPRQNSTFKFQLTFCFCRPRFYIRVSRCYVLVSQYEIRLLICKFYVTFYPCCPLFYTRVSQRNFTKLKKNLQFPAATL